MTLHEDGTKIREWKGIPNPTYPESVDLKITNQCDMACAYCHENSTPNGDYASFQHCIDLVAGLTPGIEVAIGGGDPLSHPELQEILQVFSAQGLICNITCHYWHASKNRDILTSLVGRKLVYGVGLSGAESTYHIVSDLVPLFGPNVVLHFIAGLDSPWDIINCATPIKALILGYKQYGRGAAYYSERVENNLGYWRYWLPRVLSSGSHISFDNLAIKQLRVKDFVSSEVWESSYMGDDGRFTFYVDAVSRSFAKSSVDNRSPMNDWNILDAFSSIRSSNV